MIRFLLLFLLMVTTNLAKADLKAVVEAHPDCQTFIRADEQNAYFGFGRYLRGTEQPRQQIPAMIDIVSIRNPEMKTTIKTADGAVDLMRIENSLFVLTYSEIEEWDLASLKKLGSYPTSNVSRTLMYREHASSFARYNDKLIISHGRLGISIFDITSRKAEQTIRLAEEQSPLESQAMALTIKGDEAYIAMAEFSIVRPGDKPPFAGIVVFDLKARKVARELGQLPDGVETVDISSDDLLVGFGGPVYKYALSSLTGEKLPRAKAFVPRTGEQGHFTGRGFYDEANVYTCFTRHVFEPSPRAEKVSRVFDRKVLGF
jgi:hypothetical protein